MWPGSSRCGAQDVVLSGVKLPTRSLSTATAFLSYSFRPPNTRLETGKRGMFGSDLRGIEALGAAAVFNLHYNKCTL